jgi:hypothetical protein
MPRLIPWGTPSRTDRYVFPRRRLRAFWLSLAGGGAVVAALAGIYALGGRRTASPGPVSSGHAPIEAKCASCHAPEVADVRCERCHDPFGTNRYRNAGHVWFGTRDEAKIRKAPTVPCADCHSDHHGRGFLMTRVDERNCAHCHFATISRHPEFGLVKLGVMKDEGIKFSHKKHIEEMKKAKLDTCQYCHEPTRDRKGFEPVSFDRHCARCHAKTGSVGNTDPVREDAVVAPDQIDAPWAEALAANVQKLPRGRFAVNNVRHRDPWILYNLWKIWHEIDPDGVAKKRAALVARINELKTELGSAPLSSLTPASLKQERNRLRALRAAAAKNPARRAERKKWDDALARIDIEIELGPPQMAPTRQRGRSQLESELSDRQAELADFDSAGTPAPLTPEQREIARQSIAALIGPCTKCHIFNGPLMAPIHIAQAVLARARFNHLPHVEQATCTACHAKITGSIKAEDVNIPGVALCQKCHTSRKARADCAECHFYHPPSEPWPPVG